VTRLNSAIEVAAIAHVGQVRKGTNTPYISHPYAVGMMLARAGCAEDMVIAGILHDTVEDTDLTLDYIEEHFGPGVARIVEGCSEPHKGNPWEERKSHTLQYLRTAPWDIRVVSCADKLHNIQTVSETYQSIGDRVWERFKRGRKEQEWYYRGLVESLCSPHEGEDEVPFCKEFREEVERVFGEA
jgi:(p)ppGpp synthase/HD superfamily hydrolase